VRKKITRKAKEGRKTKGSLKKQRRQRKKNNSLGGTVLSMFHPYTKKVGIWEKSDRRHEREKGKVEEGKRDHLGERG